MRQRPSYWRNAGRRLTIYGIPAPLFLLYLFWCRWPSMVTLYACTGVLACFVLLSRYGWTLQVLMQRIMHRIRGNKVSGRPWWFRRFYD